jgi:hypothetical protein
VLVASNFGVLTPRTVENQAFSVEKRWKTAAFPPQPPYLTLRGGITTPLGEPMPSHYKLCDKPDCTTLNGLKRRAAESKQQDWSFE